jgi:serine protease Do
MRATFTYLIGPQKGERAEFDNAAISIGRAANNMLCLGDGARRVSSHHAEVFRRGSQYLLRDLGSTNGTMINGRRVVVSELNPDDMIEFGAGGPLMRFGVDHPEDQIETISTKVPGLGRDGSTADLRDAVTSEPRNVAGPKANATLIAALAAAMVIGGLAGIFGSSRFRPNESDAMSYAEIAEQSGPTVVLLRAEFELLDSSGQVTTTEARTGSGFIVSSDGLIVTNRHLVRDWEYSSSSGSGRITKIEAILPRHMVEEAVPAEVYKLGPEKAADVAILKLSLPAQRFVQGFEGDTANTNPGDEVVVIGYPLGLELLQWTRDTTANPSLSTGIVSRVGHDFIQLNLRAYHGNSGGPVLNRKGQVIGILTANLGSAQDIALCTPISAALALVKNEMGYNIDSSAGVQFQSFLKKH